MGIPVNTSRAIGIRASAVISLLGSAATLLLTFVTVRGAFRARPSHQIESPIPLKLVAIGMAVFLTALAAWGIATAIAIIRRRRWARISILVFGALLAIFSALSALTTAVMPFPTPAGGAPVLASRVRWGITALYGLLAAIGAWWLVLFNRKRSIEYFAGGTPAREGARPLSVSIIAWWLLSSGVFTLVLGLFGFPAMLLGLVATAWRAKAIYVVYAAAEVYLAVGLLRLRDRARWWSIVFFAFTAVNTVVFWLLPDPNGRMQSMMGTYRPSLRTQAGVPQYQGSWAVASIASVALCSGLPVWFLTRRRQAFRT
jgi:hypothetical protein